MKRKFKMGAIALQTILTIAGPLCGVVSVYFINLGATNDRISVAKEEIKEDISKDRERISAVETDSKNYKEDIREVKGDIKTLLTLLKKS